jgi:hypothetical protein
MSNETKQKIREKAIGRNWCDSTKQKNSHRIKIKNIKTNEVKEFYSIKEADRQMGPGFSLIAAPKCQNYTVRHEWIITEINGVPFEKKKWIEKRNITYKFYNVITKQTKSFLTIRQSNVGMKCENVYAYSLIRYKKTICNWKYIPS